MGDYVSVLVVEEKELKRDGGKRDGVREEN